MKSPRYLLLLATAAVAIVGIVVYRLVRRSRLYRAVVAVAVIDLGTQVLLVGLGFALLYSRESLEAGTDLGTAPTWHSIAFALPLALLAYTGLETVANLAEETRRPGRTLPRSLFAAIGLTVAIYTAIGLVALSAFPAESHENALGGDWVEAPIMGVVAALSEDLPSFLGDALRVYVGLTAVLILLTAATTSISGFGRLAYSLGEHDQHLPPDIAGRADDGDFVGHQSVLPGFGSHPRQEQVLAGAHPYINA